MWKVLRVKDRKVVGLEDDADSFGVYELDDSGNQVRCIAMYRLNDEEKAKELAALLNTKEDRVAEMPEQKPMTPKVTVHEMEVDGRQKVQIISETAFVGAFPNIDLPTDVNINEIPANERVFVTLPIGQFNAASLNGRTYTEVAMRQLIDQINTNRPESNWGHIKDEDYGYKYSEPPVRWLAAAFDADGVVWGKARALTPESQRYFRNAKIDNARVGTSISAWGTMDEDHNVIGLELITIDLADPARVGVPITAAKPVITHDMVNNEENEENAEVENPNEEDENVGAVAPEEKLTMEEAKETLLRQMFGMDEQADILVELNRVRVAVTEAQKLAEKVTKLETENAEQATKVEEAESQIKTLTETVTSLTTEKSTLIGEAQKSLIESKVKTEKAREFVNHLMEGKTFASFDEMKAAVEAVLGLGYVKDAIASELSRDMGGRQTRPTFSQPDMKTKMSQYLEMPSGESEGS